MQSVVVSGLVCARVISTGLNGNGFGFRFRFGVVVEVGGLGSFIINAHLVASNLSFSG